ncbi:MAG: tRNA preQ1(34) S-adenosylmethionine ribosyltransferase-isomerase QueA [Coriobacteriales bacterium]|jgi:S-adenosylmethionine:tRNA ribosyltransferase-isomerase|nr:tRNA preQ1(34) S-adenosylmethionine ribosyltransferase-isomerase QueA [Coriobacteriales bacterium]
MTRLELFDYELPESLIAQYPSEQRDASRLLVINRADGSLLDRRFSDLPTFLREGDVLVLNNSRVMHARLRGTKLATGARVELFLLGRVRKDGSRIKEEGKDGEKNGRLGAPTSPVNEIWEVLARPARRLNLGDVVYVSDDLFARVVRGNVEGSLLVSLECTGSLPEVIRRVGKVPLPPYIRREAQDLDALRYQTVYADKTGSAAAPTAGLHFTTEMLDELRKRGVQTAFVTLHVGLGTFRPVQTEDIEDHHMHEEFYHIGADATAAINAAKREGRRVICVGTTSVRTLESAVRFEDFAGQTSNPATPSVASRLPSDQPPLHAAPPTISPGWGSTDIFIYPGGLPFRITDALITNFHLPKSTLLMLVSAFYEREKILAAYAHAVAARYRFFSYGDAMLIM